MQQAKKLIVESGSNALIEIDGGVTLNNAQALIKAGADALVAGSFIFSAPNPALTISELKKIGL